MTRRYVVSVFDSSEESLCVELMDFDSSICKEFRSIDSLYDYISAPPGAGGFDLKVSKKFVRNVPVCCADRFVIWTMIDRGSCCFGLISGGKTDFPFAGRKDFRRSWLNLNNIKNGKEKTDKEQ